MRRRAAKIDANQPELVKGLRDIPGVSVRSLAAVGDGMPDLLVGYQGRNHLLECKDPSKPLSKRKLTPDQCRFFESWHGHATKVETLSEALVAIGIPA